MDRVTIATSSGYIWAVLVSHFGAGLIALVAGAIALAVAKGGRLHKQSGMVFTVTMSLAGILASVIALYEGKTGMIFGGLFTAYLIISAMTTVRPSRWSNRTLDIFIAVLVFGYAGYQFWRGAQVWQLPGHAYQGVPAGMILFLGTIALCAAIGDVRILRSGTLTGARRLARHLWRMCFGLFIATGSFFFGQMKFIPEQVRFMPLVAVLGVGPLVILLYWMWRVRLRRKLKGLILSAPQPART